LEARAGRQGGSVNLIIRVALLFFLIQFLVVLTIMVVALLVARPEAALLGRKTGRKAFLRALAYLISVRGRALRVVVRLARFVRSKLVVPVYRLRQ
jgi:magnesium-transporting ATPase (P-type)